MKVSKYTLIVCWIITIFSFAAIVILHAKTDIKIQEIITQTKWSYDFEERDFYQSIWSNIFTGAIVSVITTYVSYFHQKHNVEFELKMSEIMLSIKFGLLDSSMYAIDLKDRQNNHVAIARFINQITEIHNQYDRMIVANNDYSPFLRNQKAKTLLNGKILTQKIWLDICGVEDDLIIYKTEESMKATIDKTREKISVWHEQLKELSEKLNKY